MLIPSSRYLNTTEQKWPGAAIPPGWLPVDITGGVPIVRWIKVGLAPLTDPFFAQTVSNRRGGGSSVPECETDISILERGAADLPFVTPSGIICHMTRCGSTLLANAMRAAREATILSEASAIGRVIGWIGSPSRHWAMVGSKLIEPLIKIFAHYQGSDTRHIVIKCGNEGFHSLRTLRAAWPEVPVLVLIRDPIEVLVSNFQQPPRWFLDWYDSPTVTRFGTPPPEVLAGGAAEYCAWTIGRFCSEALAVVDNGCRVLDYADLTPEVAKRVGSYFNLSFSPEGERSFLEVFRYNVKYPNRVFEADSETKRLAATERIKTSAARWVDGPYAELRKQVACWDDL